MGAVRWSAASFPGFCRKATVNIEVRINCYFSADLRHRSCGKLLKPVFLEEYDECLRWRMLEVGMLEVGAVELLFKLR